MSRPAPHSVWQRVGGLRLHARAWHGPGGDGPVLVLVHGLGVSSRYMVPTARRLARRYRVLAPDLPGWGKSDTPGRALSIPELADALAGWSEAAGLPPAVYLGNSLGCQVIIDLALRHPARVARAVLVGPTVDPEGRTLLQQVGRAVLDVMMEPFSLWPILLGDYLRAGPWRTLLTFQYALAEPLVRKLPGVRQPVLLVRGTLDPIAPRPWLERMRELLPDARLAVLPQATHAANYSAPDELTRLVHSFVADRPLPKTGLPPRVPLSGPRPGGGVRW